MRTTIVVAPISNDKFPASNNQKTGGSDTKNNASTNKNSAEANTLAADTEIRKQADDTVNVDRASQLYRSATSERAGSTGNINTAEEAAQLAARISKQLVANGAQALQAQAGGLTNQVSSLLSTAP